MAPSTTAATEPKRSEARERLLSTAMGIFYADGIRTVGVDRIIAEAGVTKATFYRHFPSKEDLVLAYLRTAHLAIRRELESVAETAERFDLLRAIAGGVAHDVCRPGFRGCAFINAGAEYADAASPVRHLVKEHRDWFQQFLVDAFAAAGHTEPGAAADHFALLRDGAMVRGYLSDPAAAGDMLVRGMDGMIRVIEGGWLDRPS
ncbi:MAG: TetR/AcrR family transcriptional regulator [Aeromicrobium sp.]